MYKRQAPGSSARILSNSSSAGSAITLAATTNTIAQIKPMPPTMTAGNIIEVIMKPHPHYLNRPSTIPLKPIKLTEQIAAAVSVIGMP